MKTMFDIGRDLVNAYNQGFNDGVKSVERKHGKWITKYPLSTCSVCEQTMILHDFANYCPNCGADMREEHADV